MTVLPFQPERFLYAAVGDVHGDLPALVAAVDAVRAKAAESGRGAFVVVLGDAIDRGRDSAGCAAFLMRLARGLDPARKDARLLFVRGDHDLGLSWNPATRSFSSLVEPAEWAEELGALPPHDPEREIARAWIEFVLGSPAAVLLRGEAEGALLAHGAVPHADLLPRLKTLADLGSPECDRDFAWCRLSSARRKIPNRASLFCDVGLDDLADALDRIGEIAAGEATGEGSSLPEPHPPLFPEAPQGPHGAATPAEPRIRFAPHRGEGFGEGRSPSPVRLFVHGHEHAETGCEAVPVRGGRTAWTVTTFRGKGVFGAIRPAVLLLDHAETAEIESHAESAEIAEIESHAESAEGAEIESHAESAEIAESGYLAGSRAAEPRDPADAGSAPARTRGAAILAKPLFLEDLA